MKTGLSVTANVFACLLIAGMPGFWGCASMDGDEKGDNDMPVSEADLSEALTKSLDSIFSAKNALASDIKFTSESLLFVIDNPQEFLTVCDDAAISTQINFEENCLIWGKFKSPSISNKIAGSELLEVRKNVYTYEIVMDWCVGCYAAIGVHYFWSIHPKISNKDIQLIIKEKEENNMTFPREVVEAVDIYSAFEGECHLQLNKMDRNKVYVINSKESLSEFVSCDEICQTVNLNKKTLLLAHGSTNFDVHLKSYKLTQLSKGDFQLDADIEEGMATVPTGNWQVALLIPKIAQDATVNLTVNVTRLSDLNKSLQ